MAEIFEADLYSLYLTGGWDDIYDFPTFKAKCELSGMKIIKEESNGLEKSSG